MPLSFQKFSLWNAQRPENPKVIENIKRIEKFLIVSIHNELIIPADFVPCPPHEIMKKDLGVSTLRKPEEDSNLAYLIP